MVGGFLIYPSLGYTGSGSSHRLYTYPSPHDDSLDVRLTHTAAEMHVHGNA